MQRQAIKSARAKNTPSRGLQNRGPFAGIQLANHTPKQPSKRRSKSPQRRRSGVDPLRAATRDGITHMRPDARVPALTELQYRNRSSAGAAAQQGDAEGYW